MPEVAGSSDEMTAQAFAADGDAEEEATPPGGNPEPKSHQVSFRDRVSEIGELENYQVSFRERVSEIPGPPDFGAPSVLTDDGGEDDQSGERPAKTSDEDGEVEVFEFKIYGESEHEGASIEMASTLNPMSSASASADADEKAAASAGSTSSEEAATTVAASSSDTTAF